MAENPQPMTLQQRIASLNAAHIGRVPCEAPLPRQKPQVPQKRPVVIRQKTAPQPVNGSVVDLPIHNLPAAYANHNGTPSPPVEKKASLSRGKTPPPPLPSRQPSIPNLRPPPLPSRRESQPQSRRGSDDSVQSAVSSKTSNELPRLPGTRTKSTDSASSRVKAPAWGETSLPPLPPRGAVTPQRKYSTEKPKYLNRAPSAERTVLPAATLSSLSQDSIPPVPPIPQLPTLPQRPPRPSAQKTQAVQNAAKASLTALEQVPRPKIPTTPTQTAVAETIKQPATSFTLNKFQSEITAVKKVPVNAVHTTIAPQPPPVPLLSRPDLSSLQATKTRPSSTSTQRETHQSMLSASCLVCRDFSGPDQYASLLPRSQVSSLQTLAQQLTEPFASHTDKARAIFSWLHHNISYDVDSFFGNCVKASTPQSTLQSGLAVCEGYAALFTTLATYAGLESVVISGHGKGFGHQQLAPNSPLPPFSGNHAWNAVKIDNDEWKLIDTCWGAGHVQGAGLPYVKEFHVEQFTMSNEEFGIKHFPVNKDQFFLPGGRRMNWEEYIQINPASWPDGNVEPPTVFSNAKVDYSIGERTVLPRSRKLDTRSGRTVRFQFALLCPHWTLERHTKKGPPPVFMLAVHGVDGRNKDHIPLEHVRGQEPGGGGEMWYLDVPARELGAAGQTVTLFAVTSFGSKQDARGLTVREFKEGKGRVGMGFMGVAAWDLV